MRRVRVLVAGAMVAASVALPATTVADDGRRDERAYTILNPPLPPLTVGGTSSEVQQGVLRGAAYIIEVPPVWNGELVMWAHGYRGTGTVLSVGAPGYGMRQRLLDLGYAWAASSYDRNGYDVESGVRTTRELAREFGHLVSRPARTYIAGESMGGHVTARSIEQYPSLYDGALPMCGVVGDVELFDFFLDYTLVAQALAGVDNAFPIPANYTTVAVPRMQAALGTAGMPIGGSPTNELGLQFREIVIQQSGGPRPGAEHAFSSWKDFLFGLPTPDTGGPIALNPGRVGTNVDTEYTPGVPDAIDADVRRVPPRDPVARRSQALRTVALVEGRPSVPVLTLHDIGDLFVPFSMEQYYAADVAANRRSELLVQRAIRAIGHCEFSPTEVHTAFDDLVAWVEDGVRPAGDDVTDPAAVAADDFGCRFTDAAAWPTGSRPLIPRC